MTKSKKLTERVLQSQFIKSIRRESPTAYIHVDKDSPARMFRSDWDFLVTLGGVTRYVECKLGDGKLTPNQKKAQIEIQRSGGEYLVARFINVKSADHFDVHALSNKTNNVYYVRPESDRE